MQSDSDHSSEVVLSRWELLPARGQRTDGHGTFDSNFQAFTLQSRAYNLVGPESKLRNHQDRHFEC
jgi:hypothetical protein